MAELRELELKLEMARDSSYLSLLGKCGKAHKKAHALVDSIVVHGLVE